MIGMRIALPPCRRCTTKFTHYWGGQPLPVAKVAHPILDRFNVRRALIFRALKLGDMLCTIPALRAIRKGLPDAEIVVAGLPCMPPLMERYSAYVDGFRSFPGYPGL